jgi:hypothetical protein
MNAFLRNNWQLLRESYETRKYKLLQNTECINIIQNGTILKVGLLMAKYVYFFLQ